MKGKNGRIYRPCNSEAPSQPLDAEGGEDLKNAENIRVIQNSEHIFGGNAIGSLDTP